jgi:uncharacterized protein
VRDGGDVFHLAIPAYDLAETREFYVDQLGCKLARSYEDRITLDFFGDQVVCHLTPRPTLSGEPLNLYPRHFGVTFRAEQDFESVYELCLLRGIELFNKVSVRFEGRVEAHRTFVVRDPSDNLIEFKHYSDHRMMY